MKKFYRKVQRGAAPGSMDYTGNLTDVKPRIRVLNYDAEKLDDLDDQSAESALAFKTQPSTTWINVDGLSDEKIVETLGTSCNLHPLIIEDILHTSQRPKMEDLGDAIYLVARMLSLSEASEIQSEQISFILAKNTLISFQESPGDVFDTIRTRIRKKQGRVRSKGSDYLLYLLMDAIIDNYFYVLEHIGERIEVIETALMDDPYPSLLTDLYSLKRELLYVRKSVWPLREAVSLIDRGENPLFKDSTHVYLRDLYDHTIQVIDTVETFRDMLSGVQDLYLSSLGNKTNQVMKVLTIISTIFIPITFVAGIYGMNFEVMPELHWRYGYATVWLIMIALILAMLLFFRRQKWF